MIRIKDISKIYRTGKGEVKALDNVSLQIEEGEFIAVKGRSGSGKTTLLLTAGGMLSPTNGEVDLLGVNIYSITPGKRAEFRAENIGFVFQMYYLAPYLNTLENVLLAAGPLKGISKKKDALDLLERLDLSHRIDHKPSELSSGEKQRTAIARALLNKPKLILADEPTGNLDKENAKYVFQHLADFNSQGGAVIVVTHGDDSDQYAKRIIYLENGRVVQ